MTRQTDRPGARSCRLAQECATAPARGIHLVFLPPYSPEVQPAERLWPLSNEPLANRVFTSLDELEEVQAERCRWLQAHPEIVQAHTCFHWWPVVIDST